MDNDHTYSNFNPTVSLLKILHKPERQNSPETFWAEQNNSGNKELFYPTSSSWDKWRQSLLTWQLGDYHFSESGDSQPL